MVVPATSQKPGDIDFRSLPPFQRVLLVTDGTVTALLEAWFLEPVRLVKLSQNLIPFATVDAALAPEAGEDFLERKILLQGAQSGRVHVYAKSVIALDRLGAKLRTELIASDKPLGRLWLEHRLETFKEKIDMRHEPSPDIAGHLGKNVASPLLMRRYRVSAGGKPVMLISEYFSDI